MYILGDSDTRRVGEGGAERKRSEETGQAEISASAEESAGICCARDPKLIRHPRMKIIKLDMNELDCVRPKKFFPLVYYHYYINHSC